MAPPLAPPPADGWRRPCHLERSRTADEATARGGPLHVGLGECLRTEARSSAGLLRHHASKRKSPHESACSSLRNASKGIAAKIQPATRHMRRRLARKRSHVRSSTKLLLMAEARRPHHILLAEQLSLRRDPAASAGSAPLPFGQASRSRCSRLGEAMPHHSTHAFDGGKSSARTKCGFRGATNCQSRVGNRPSV